MGGDKSPWALHMSAIRIKCDPKEPPSHDGMDFRNLKFDAGKFEKISHRKERGNRSRFPVTGLRL